VRLSTVVDLTPELHDINDPDEQKKRVLILTPEEGLEAIFEKFWVTQKILATPQVVERVAYEACEDAAQDGVRILELRYQPSFIQLNHPDLTMQEIHDSIVNGCKRAMEMYPWFYVGLIGIIGRNLSMEIAEETCELVIKNRDTFIGMDLANVESFDCIPFAPLFKRVKEAGLHVTIHQGETGKAIEFKINLFYFIFIFMSQVKTIKEGFPD
jgi:adenosine deaminase